MQLGRQVAATTAQEPPPIAKQVSPTTGPGKYIKGVQITLAPQTFVAWSTHSLHAFDHPSIPGIHWLMISSKRKNQAVWRELRLILSIFTDLILSNRF